MKCTNYAQGMFLIEEDVQKVIDELKKENIYKRASKDELEKIAREAIVLHNRAQNVKLKIDGGVVSYRENGNSDIVSVPVKDVSIAANGDITIHTEGEIDLHFTEKNDGTITGNVDSEEVVNAIRLSPRYEDDLDSLFNTDMDNGTVDKLISGVKLLDNNVAVIQSKLAQLDKDSSNSTWDSEHSGHLQALNSKMHKLVKELGDVEVKVSKNAVLGLIEPMAEFDPRGGKRKVKVATADIAEQAKNRFIMGNEEALTHEYVHAYMHVLLNKNLGVLAQESKDDIRRLYAAAKKQLTYKHLLPEEDGPYSADEVAKAKEMYRYIFEGKYGNATNADANKRLEEFIAYGLTNKHMKQALAKVSLKYKKKEIPDGASFIGKLFYKALDKLQEMLSTLRHKRGRGNNIDEELTRLAMHVGEINYTYGNKAKENIAFQIDSKVNKMLNGTYETSDKEISKIVNRIMEKTKLLQKDEQTKLDELIAKMEKDHPGISKEKAIKDAKANFDREAKLTHIKQLMNAIKTAEANYINGNPLEKAWNAVKLVVMTTRVYSLMTDSSEDDFLEIRITLDTVLRQTFTNTYNLIKDLIADFSAGRKTLVEITDMTMRIKSHLDRMRDMYVKGTLKDIAQGFTKVDIMSAKSKKYKHALNRVVMRTDFQSVSTDANKLNEYLNDSSKLDSDIQSLEDEIKVVKYQGSNVGKYMLTNAKKVATYMLTKKGLRSNASNIARNFGTMAAIPSALVPVISEYNIDDVESKLDKLISLYTLKQVDSDSKEVMKELIAKDKKGVDSYLRQAKGAQIAIKADWELNGMGHEMVKGQMRETTDSNKDLVFAMNTPEVANKMKGLGYVEVRNMRVDAGDPGTNRYSLWKHNATGMTRRVDGALGLQRLQVKGLLLSDKLRDENQHLTGSALNEAVRKGISEAARKSKYDNMYPVYNDEGWIVDFRYEPRLDEMETYIDLEKRGTELLAMTFGQKNTQMYTDTNNEELIDIVMKDTEETKAKLDKSAKGRKLFAQEFIHIKVTADRKTKAELKALGADETNKLVAKTEGEELWGLLSPAARRYITKKNKEEDERKLANSLGKKVIELTAKEKNKIEPRKELYVRRDLMKQLFGYNEWMLSDSKFLKKLSPDLQRKMRVAERGIGDAVQLAKNMVVIKLPRTIIGNILSNAKFLWFAGMPAKKASEYLLLSKRSLDKWKKDERKRRRLEREIDMVSGKEAEKLKKDLADLAIEMQDNPIIPLIQEGLYQTIAEDVNMEDDNNAIVNWMEKKLDESIIGDNKKLKEVVNTVFLTRRSAVGEMLLNVTQESDFHFRAATYWYMVENGTSKKKALREVTDNFVNYNKVINSKFVQWMDRMGPEAFWKYFSNIQRINLKLIKNNTTRVALDAAGKHWLGIPADTLDSSALYGWSKRLNPFNWADNFTSLLEGGMNIPVVQVAEGF